MKRSHLLALFILSLVPPRFVAASGVVGTGSAASCTEAALNAALGCSAPAGLPPAIDCAGGGSVTFDCGVAPATITVTATRTITADTDIDGGGLITLGADRSGASSVLSIGTHPFADGLSDATVTLSNLTIADVQYIAIFNGGSLTVTNCTFSDNNADGIGGAAIYNLRGVVSVSKSTFSGNNGGAITSGGTLTLGNSTFSGNYGGPAIFNGGALVVSNSTFSINSDGAIYNGGTLTVTNSTFSGNFASYGIGGDIFSDTSAVTLTNTILANGGGGNCHGVILDGGNNIDDSGTCGLRGIGCTHPVGTSFCNTDPLLDPTGLADNGGPTTTIALNPGSPAINAGSEAACAAPPIDNLDQRGFVRPGPGATRCSIGAFEYRLETPRSTATPSPITTPTQTLIPTLIPIRSPTRVVPPTPTPRPCVGDCDHGGSVTVNELVTMVNVALGDASIPACAAGDADLSGSISVDEIIAAVNNALNGCPPGSA